LKALSEVMADEERLESEHRGKEAMRQARQGEQRKQLILKYEMEQQLAKMATAKAVKGEEGGAGGGGAPASSPRR